VYPSRRRGERLWPEPGSHISLYVWDVDFGKFCAVMMVMVAVMVMMMVVVMMMVHLSFMSSSDDPDEAS
jgi:hypothetical protein